MTEKSENSAGPAIIRGIQSFEPELPRWSSAHDDLFDDISPTGQPLLSEFYEGFRANVELSRLGDDPPGVVKITSRTFDVYCARNSPGDYFSGTM